MRKNYIDKLFSESTLLKNFVKKVWTNFATTTCFLKFFMWDCIRPICAVSQSTEMHQDAWRAWRKGGIWVCRFVFKEVGRVFNLHLSTQLGPNKMLSVCLCHTELMIKLWDISPFKLSELPFFTPARVCCLYTEAH